MSAWGPALGVVVLSCISCAPASRPAGAPPPTAGPPPLPPLSTATASVALELVGFSLLGGTTTFPALGADRFGGLSGCVSRPGTSNELLAIADERTTPRFLTLSIELGMGVRVEPIASTHLQTAAASGAPAMLDAEGITLVGASRVIVASEGDGQRQPPGLLEYDLRGRFVRTLPIPEKFLPDAKSPQARGVRENLAFEALTSLPDGRVYTASEAPLVQDDEPPTTSRGAWSRLLELAPAGDEWRAARELAYPLEPLPAAAALSDRPSITGLVDLVPLATDRFLAMERSYIGGRRGDAASPNGIRIFEIDIAGAQDVTRVASLRRLPAVRSVRKALVLDLAELAPQLGPRLKNLENFEGMCYGPTLPDRSRSLVLVSDDNFNPQQRTAFLLLRVVPR